MIERVTFVFLMSLFLAATQSVNGQQANSRSLSGDITISEIDYHPESSLDGGNWIEILNAGSISRDLSGWIIKDSNDSHSYPVPPGIVLAPDARWVFTDDTTKFKNIYRGVTNFSGPLGFGFGNNNDEVRIFDRFLNLKASVTYYDSLPWPEGADGRGRTLEVKNPLADLNDPENWFEGCIGGSPGQAYTTCNEAIIFSEINYNSNKAFNTGDWVEIRNISDTALALGGWVFMDDSTGPDHAYELPQNVILKPHSNRVLAADLAKFSALNPGVENLSGPVQFKLSGGGEWIRMYNAEGRLKLSMTYDDDPPWPKEADGFGYTLEIIDSAGNPDDGNNWTSICEGGSPGKYPGSECRNLVGPSGNITAWFYPNPATGNATLKLESIKDLVITITLYNSQGIYLSTVFQGDLKTGIHDLNINTSGFYKGMYFAVIRSGNEIELSKLIIQ